MKPSRQLLHVYNIKRPKRESVFLYSTNMYADWPALKQRLSRVSVVQRRENRNGQGFSVRTANARFLAALPFQTSF